MAYDPDQGHIPLCVVVGPTASGKTALAIELALRHNGEVVSADSMQIYRGLHIATAKPDVTEQRGIPHHLLGVVDPNVLFSAAQYAAVARPAIADIHSRGKLPILAGGTGLYIQAVIDNIDYADQSRSGSLRLQLQRRIDQEGAKALLEELSVIDPDTASRLHTNDQKRIIRALEIYHSTGKTMTEHNRLSKSRPSPYRLCMFGINCKQREELYRRIDQRTDEMLKSGLLDEARSAFEWGLSGTSTQAIGYKELIPYFEGRITLNEAVETIKRQTRRYAKRQLTWFRRDQRIYWLYRDEDDWPEIVEKCKMSMANSGIL